MTIRLSALSLLLLLFPPSLCDLSCSALTSFESGPGSTVRLARTGSAAYGTVFGSDGTISAPDSPDPGIEGDMLVHGLVTDAPSGVDSGGNALFSWVRTGMDTLVSFTVPFGELIQATFTPYEMPDPFVAPDCALVYARETGMRITCTHSNVQQFFIHATGTATRRKPSCIPWTAPGIAPTITMMSMDRTARIATYSVSFSAASQWASGLTASVVWTATSEVVAILALSSSVAVSATFTMTGAMYDKEFKGITVTFQSPDRGCASGPISVTQMQFASRMVTDADLPYGMDQFLDGNQPQYPAPAPSAGTSVSYLSSRPMTGSSYTADCTGHAPVVRSGGSGATTYNYLEFRSSAYCTVNPFSMAPATQRVTVIFAAKFDTSDYGGVMGMNEGASDDDIGQKSLSITFSSNNGLMVRRAAFGASSFTVQGWPVSAPASSSSYIQNSPGFYNTGSNWKFVAIVMQPNFGTVHMGNQAWTDTHDLTQDFLPSLFCIGARAGSSACTDTGSIDLAFAMIWKRALSGSEIERVKAWAVGRYGTGTSDFGTVVPHCSMLGTWYQRLWCRSLFTDTAPSTEPLTASLDVDATTATSTGAAVTPESTVGTWLPKTGPSGTCTGSPVAKGTQFGKQGSVAFTSPQYCKGGVGGTHLINSVAYTVEVVVKDRSNIPLTVPNWSFEDVIAGNSPPSPWTVVGGTVSVISASTDSLVAPDGTNVLKFTAGSEIYVVLPELSALNVLYTFSLMIAFHGPTCGSSILYFQVINSVTTTETWYAWDPIYSDFYNYASYDITWAEVKGSFKAQSAGVRPRFGLKLDPSVCVYAYVDKITFERRQPFQNDPRVATLTSATAGQTTDSDSCFAFQTDFSRTIKTSRVFSGGDDLGFSPSTATESTIIPIYPLSQTRYNHYLLTVDPANTIAKFWVDNTQYSDVIYFGASALVPDFWALGVKMSTGTATVTSTDIPNQIEVSRFRLYPGALTDATAEVYKALRFQDLDLPLLLPNCSAITSTFRSWCLSLYNQTDVPSVPWGRAIHFSSRFPYGNAATLSNGDAITSWRNLVPAFEVSASLSCGSTTKPTADMPANLILPPNIKFPGSGSTSDAFCQTDVSDVFTGPNQGSVLLVFRLDGTPSSSDQGILSFGSYTGSDTDDDSGLAIFAAYGSDTSLFVQRGSTTSNKLSYYSSGTTPNVEVAATGETPIPQQIMSVSQTNIVVLTWDETGSTLYINGDKYSDTHLLGSTFTPQQMCVAGRITSGVCGGDATKRAKMFVGEIMVWNRKLSANEVEVMKARMHAEFSIPTLDETLSCDMLPAESKHWCEFYRFPPELTVGRTTHFNADMITPGTRFASGRTTFTPWTNLADDYLVQASGGVAGNSHLTCSSSASFYVYQPTDAEYINGRGAVKIPSGNNYCRKSISVGSGYYIGDTSDFTIAMLLRPGSYSAQMHMLNFGNGDAAGDNYGFRMAWSDTYASNPSGNYFFQLNMPFIQESACRYFSTSCDSVFETTNFKLWTDPTEWHFVVVRYSDRSITIDADNTRYQRLLDAEGGKALFRSLNIGSMLGQGGGISNYNPQDVAFVMAWDRRFEEHEVESLKAWTSRSYHVRNARPACEHITPKFRHLCERTTI